jgi:hypothetical protein
MYEFSTTTFGVYQFYHVALSLPIVLHSEKASTATNVLQHLLSEITINNVSSNNRTTEDIDRMQYSGLNHNDEKKLIMLKAKKKMLQVGIQYYNCVKVN